MKRSLAIQILANILKLTGNHYCDDGRDVQDATEMLDAMEGIGMEPPQIPTGASGWEIGKGHPAYVNKWEKE